MLTGPAGVDEGDAARLSLWDGKEGSTLTSLAPAGVGALATQDIATRYGYGATSGRDVEHLPVRGRPGRVHG